MPSGSKSEWFSGEIGMAKRYEHLHCKHRGGQEACEALRHAGLSSAKGCEEQKSERGRACPTDDERSTQSEVGGLMGHPSYVILHGSDPLSVIYSRLKYKVRFKNYYTTGQHGGITNQ
jgi:hypothetical protein